MSEATAIKDLREALARAQRAEARVAELEQQVASATQACNVAVAQAMKLERDVAERLAVNVGLIAENTELKRKAALAHKEETP